MKRKKENRLKEGKESQLRDLLGSSLGDSDGNGNLDPVCGKWPVYTVRQAGQYMLMGCSWMAGGGGDFKVLA